MGGVCFVLRAAIASPRVAIGQDDPGPPPAWTVRGLANAEADEAARDRIADVPPIGWLISGRGTLAPDRMATVVAALAGRLDRQREPNPGARFGG